MDENCFKELKTLNNEKISLCIMECLGEYCGEDEESQIYLQDGRTYLKYRVVCNKIKICDPPEIVTGFCFCGNNRICVGTKNGDMFIIEKDSTEDEEEVDDVDDLYIDWRIKISFHFYNGSLTKMKISLPCYGGSKTDNDNSNITEFLENDLNCYCLTGIASESIFFQFPVSAINLMVSKEISFSELLKNNVMQKYSLTSLSSIYDYIFCPHLPSHSNNNNNNNNNNSIYEFIYPKSDCSNLLVCGKYPILTLYQPGSKSNNFNLRTIISNLANRISNTVTNVYFQLKKSWGIFSYGNSNNNSNNGNISSSSPSSTSSNNNVVSPTDENIDYTLLLSTTTISSESIISDPTRIIDKLIYDPTLRYCISKDNFGRVLLIDINRNIILKMWKGYRDADFGWFEAPEMVFEKNTEKDEPSSLKSGDWGSYLVIYAPYRNSIEIFRMNECKRVYVKILNENDKYYLRTISKEGPLSHLLNIPTKCYLIKENLKTNMNEMKLIEIKLPLHSLDFIYMKKYSKSLAKDNYYMKILLKLLTNEKIDEKLMNEVKRVIEMNDLSQLKLQEEVFDTLEEKDILILKMVYLIQSSILLKHILKKIEKGGLYNISENLIRKITDTIYQRVNIEINKIATSNEYKENENGIKELMLSSYESVRWSLKCKLHLLDIYDKINNKYYNDIIKNEENIKIEEIFNEEYRKDESDNKIIEKLTKLKEFCSKSVKLNRNEEWKLNVMKPVMFLCCLEASSSSSSSSSSSNDLIPEKDKEEEEKIKYEFRSNNISESTSILFSSYLFQLLLFHPDKIEEIYNIQNELFLSNETMIILSYLWITSIPFQQIIKFPFSVYNKWLNIFEKRFNESKTTTTTTTATTSSLDSFIYESIIPYVLKSNRLLNTLLYIDNIQKYCNNNNGDNSLWNNLLYKINITIGLSIVNEHIFTISDISQNSIFDLINQLFYHFNHKYNVLQETLVKLKDEIKEEDNNNNIVNDINISDDISKVYSLFKILPYQYLNIDFLWFNFINSIIKNYDFQNNMNEFDEIYKLVSYINNRQMKRTILYIIWNDYLFPIMRSIVETKEESSNYGDNAINTPITSTVSTSNSLSDVGDDSNILRFKMIIIQYSISALSDIKLTLNNEEKETEEEKEIIINDLFPSNNFYNLHLEILQNFINNYNKSNIYSTVSIDIHLLYFRIIRLLLPSGDLFPNQWIELLDIFKCKDILLIPNSLLKSVFMNDEIYDNNLNNIISSEDAINFLIKTLEVHSDIAYDLGCLLNIDENQIKVEICRMYYLHNDDEEGEKIYSEISDKNNINPALFYLIRQRLSFYIYFLRETKMRELEMEVDMKILKWIRKALPKDASKIPSQPLPFTLSDVGKLINVIKMSNSNDSEKESVNYDGISIDDLGKVCDALL